MTLPGAGTLTCLSPYDVTASAPQAGHGAAVTNEHSHRMCCECRTAACGVQPGAGPQPGGLESEPGRPRCRCRRSSVHARPVMISLFQFFSSDFRSGVGCSHPALLTECLFPSYFRTVTTVLTLSKLKFD